MATIPTEPRPTGLALLRVPFEAHHISKLPKESKNQRLAREKDSGLIVWKCDVCGGIHHKDAVHLDYVGHAAITDRLLEADPEWDWQPMAVDDHGLPLIQNGCLWIKLTVCGKTRIGIGTADGKQGGDAVKELIGDALRNAGMRFGMALDLWHKGDLHGPDAPERDPNALDDNQWAMLQQLLQATGSNIQAFCDKYRCRTLGEFPAQHYDHAVRLLNTKLERMAAAQRNLPSADIDNGRGPPTDTLADMDRRQREQPPRTEFSDVLEDEIPF